MSNRYTQLIEEWRENAEIDVACGNHDAADRWKQASNELEEVIENDE